MNVDSRSERRLLVWDISGNMTCYLRMQFKFVFKKLVGPSFNMVVFMHFKESWALYLALQLWRCVFYQSFSMESKIGSCHLNLFRCWNLSRGRLRRGSYDCRNGAAIIALGWNTLRSVCTIRKLKFLRRVTTNQESICHRAFSATVDDVESLSLVRECRKLEQRYKSNFTSTILCAHGEDGLDIIQNAQKSIYKIDQSLLLQKASEYPFLTQIARCTG